MRSLGRWAIGRLGDSGEVLGFEERGCGNSHELAALVLLFREIELRGL